MNPLPVMRTRATRAGDVLAAERRAYYAWASAGRAELLMRDQAITRVEYERRAREARQAEEEFRRLRAGDALVVGN